MKRIASLFLIMIMCFSFLGAAARPAEADSLSQQPALAALKKNGTDVVSASSLSMFDTVTFGRYPQGTYGESADIEWLVVGFDGNNRVKLLSRYGLDSRQFHETEDAVSWTSTTLYVWLNSTFKYNAFAYDEQSLIADISIPTVEEARALPVEYRRCYSTSYAIAQGADPMSCRWWLSDQGRRIEQVDYWGEKQYYYCASVVNEYGEVVPAMYQANFHHKVVRPLVLVDLNNGAADQRKSALVQRRGAAIRSASDLNLYDTITFGRYTQSPYAAPAPIEWIVVGFEGGRVKLIAKYGLDTKRYHDTHSMVTWTGSTLYSWLNNSFKYVAFTSAEQDLLVNGVTLPGVMDAESLPLIYRGTLPTASALAGGMNRKQCIWWLSEPTQQITYQASGGKGWCASAVKENGEDVRAGYQINYEGKAIRPMILLDLTKLP